MNRFEKEFLLKYNYGDGAKTVDEILKNFKINENVEKDLDKTYESQEKN